MIKQLREDICEALREIMYDHKDVNDCSGPDFESSVRDCQWCADAKKIIKEIEKLNDNV